MTARAAVRRRFEVQERSAAARILIEHVGRVTAMSNVEAHRWASSL